MRLRMLTLLIFLLTALSVFGQTNDYSNQVMVIEAMLEEANYRAAKAQSQALIKSGEEAQLPLVKAEGHRLLGRALTESKQATAKERVAGIRELKLAAQLFRKERKGEAVEDILGRLEKLTGNRKTETVELPSARKRRSKIPNADSINEASLSAIVSVQNQTITALNDSQVRQMLQLQEQERELDALAFQILNDSILLIQQESVIDRQQAVVQQEKLRRNFLLALAGGILLVLASLYFRFRSSKRYQAKLEEQNQIISRERKRSDELLRNILPATVAEELKTKGKATARSYPSVSVLFADFKGFSALASTLDPETLVSLLDETFRAFDEIVRKHRLEKIKTIGDCYMCAGGLPEPDTDHAERMVRAALDIQAYLETNDYFKARIGIHSGPVVAGVVGQDKFVYDIWGDTVNQAARLEAAGDVGRVAISQTTKELLPDTFVVEPAGTFDAKNIGPMERFFVRQGN
ncbi:Adenylate cyclase, class 3 [Neolewinella agarilytica]|uniref:Adenylate cyclase, class 3 n=3 Tax=Neolewinella agarilytica TaxID=478744 RepID=A0A1H9EEP9_9BACT|nr:Adenylate cyclase, class 3 [Neolewinella agarilytica]